jgi:hypothetical protein
MANVYKNAIYVPTTTANTTVYTCNATARAVIQTIQLTNLTSTNTATVQVYDSSLTSTTKINHVSLAANTTENTAKGPIILEEGDALIISCSNTAITGIVSIMEVNRGSLTN